MTLSGAGLEKDIRVLHLSVWGSVTCVHNGLDWTLGLEKGF